MGNGEGSVEGLGMQNIDFPGGKCRFLETGKCLLRAWEGKILIFLQENVNKKNREGSVEGLGRQNIDFPAGK